MDTLPKAKIPIGYFTNPEAWQIAFNGFPNYDPQLQLIVPNSFSLSAHSPEEIGHRKDIAIVCGWMPLEKLESLPNSCYDVISSSYQSKLGAELILWGLATRPWIRTLIVTGFNVADIYSGNDTLLELAKIKTAAKSSEDYHATFRYLLGQSEVIPANFAADMLPFLSTILEEVDIVDFSGTVSVEDITDKVSSIPEQSPANRDRLFLPLAYNPEQLPQLNVEAGPQQLRRDVSGDIPNIWRELLTRINLFGNTVEEGRIRQLMVNMVIPFEDPDHMAPTQLADLGLTAEDLRRYYPQVIAPYLLGQKEHQNNGADYTYAQRIFGLDAFPEAWAEIDSGQETLSPTAGWLSRQYRGWKPENQFAGCVDALVNNPFSRHAHIALWDQRLDLRKPNPPCITSIYFLANQAMQVDMIVNIRSNDAYKAFPKNLLALMKLFQLLLDEINSKSKHGFIPGCLNIQVDSSHIYNQDSTPARIESAKFKRLPFAFDPRGNLIVDKIDDGRVVVRFQSGETILSTQPMRLNKPDDITRFAITVIQKHLWISDPMHAVYLATQLTRLLLKSQGEP